jgi:hypothetical protein
LEPKYTITYDENGGTAGSGPALMINLVENANYVLDTITKPTHPGGVLGGSPTAIVFIGWSLAPDLTIYERNDTVPTTPVTSASIPLPGANVIVYAVWGYDDNNNGIADVLEGPERSPGGGYGNATVRPPINDTQPPEQIDPVDPPSPPSPPGPDGQRDPDPISISMFWILLLIILDVLLFMYRRRFGDKVFDEKKNR